MYCYEKGRILQHAEDEAFSGFYSFESGGEKKNSNGLMEMYRGSQGRVAMTTSIYSTMTCFEFLSVLFEYVIRVLAAQPDNPPGETFGISRVPKCSPAPKEIKKT